MKTLCLLATIATAAAGCTELTPVPTPTEPMRILLPGKQMLLAYRCEIQSTAPDKQGDTSIDWAELELPVTVTAVPRSDAIRAAMRVTLVRAGHDVMSGGTARRDAPAEGPMRISTPRVPPAEDDLHDAQFIAIVDPHGRLNSVDAAGAPWSERKRNLAEALRRGTSPQQTQTALRSYTPGMFSALEDALAYLPPENVWEGFSYQVLRDRVLPYNMRGFSAMTNGCTYCQEQSACRVSAVKLQWPNQIAVFSIQGRRIPRDPDPGMPRKVDYFDVSGELEINLTTRAVERLRIQTVPVYVGNINPLPKVVYVDVISLRPL